MKHYDMLSRLQLQLFLFPTLVVLLACFSFFCGGSCSVWQWWGAMTITLVVPFCSAATRRAALGSSLLFLGIVLGFIAASHFYLDSFGIDHVKYHFPATGLLIEGWNPIYAATPESIHSTMGVDPEDMCWLQVLFMHKGVWIFNAVAYLFHGQPLAISFSAGYFVFWAVAVTLYNVLKEWRPGYRIALILVLFARCYFTDMVVDSVCSLSTFALMVVMAENLHARKFSGGALVLLSFWMICSKAPGLLACAVCWSVFAIMVLWRCRTELKRTLQYLCALGAVIACLFGVSCASPYLTAWREFKHPFYPMCTVDEEQYPIQSMAADFLVSTDDWKKMTPFDFFVNAYVSPALAQRFCAWRNGQKDFRPVCACWVFNPEHAPTHFKDRCRIWFIFLVLLLLSRYRFIGIAGLCVLVAAPPYLYGWLRYFWWMHCLLFFVPLAALALVHNRIQWRYKSILYILPIAALAYLSIWPGMNMVKNLKSRAEAEHFSVRLAYSQVYPDTQLDKFDPDSFANEDDRKLMLQCHGSADSYVGARMAVNNVKLLAKRWGNLKGVKVIPITKRMARTKKFTKFGFYVD